MLAVTVMRAPRCSCCCATVATVSRCGKTTGLRSRSCTSMPARHRSSMPMVALLDAPAAKATAEAAAAAAAPRLERSLDGGPPPLPLTEGLDDAAWAESAFPPEAVAGTKVCIRATWLAIQSYSIGSDAVPRRRETPPELACRANSS